MIYERSMLFSRYRGYLDSLRKTSGRGSTVSDIIPLSNIFKNVPQVLPLALIDDSLDDPEFIHLLRKTTTESIRKLWNNKAKSSLLCTTAATYVVPNTEEKETKSENLVKVSDPKGFELCQGIEVVNCELIKVDENQLSELDISPENDDNEESKLIMTSTIPDSFDWGKSTMTETIAPTSEQSHHPHQQATQNAQQRPHFPTGSLLKHQQKLIHQHNLQRQILKHQQQLQQQQEQQKHQNQQNQLQQQIHNQQQQQQQQHQQQFQQQQQQQQAQLQQQKQQTFQTYQQIPQVTTFQYDDQQDQHIMTAPFDSVDSEDHKHWFTRAQGNSSNSYIHNQQARHLISDNCNNSQLLASGSNTMLLQTTNPQDFDRKVSKYLFYTSLKTHH